ncbi:MAG: 50S ribosomal protein L4 [Cellulosilyticaceae bacterium]
MANVAVYNMNGQQVGEVELNDAIFAVDVKEHLVHTAVVSYLANRRQGTQSTKTRAEVRGGGRKPWRQKGTGRARQGSIRSPQWTGGGVVFAPKPRDYSFKLNKKERRLALKSALTSRVIANKMIVLDTLELSDIKTKAMQNVLDAIKVNKALVVTAGEASKNVMLSARNIQGIKTAAVNNINVYDILKYDAFVVTKEALSKIEEVYA